MGAAFAVLATLFSACPRAADPTPPEVLPVITSFAADKTMVTAGTAVKLSFTAERAKEVTLLDQAGNTIALSGDAAAGEATVMPTETSFYVLRVSGDGGRDSAFVQVAVNEGLRQVFLVAVPAEVNSGETVTVAWSALGGTGITLRDASGATLSMAESGSLDLQPPRSTSYELRAMGVAGPLTATAAVKVRPVVQSFTATPPAARQGEKLSFAWKTAGAESVRLTETTLGEIVTITSQASVDDGTFEFTVPTDFSADAGMLPDGGTPAPRPVPDNYPLLFTLTAQTTNPAQAVSAPLQTYVRNGPAIVTFDVPPFVTETKPVTVRWTTSNTHRAELLLDGAPVFATLPPATANGSFTLPTVTADVAVTLVAYDFNGLSVRQTKTLKIAKAPKVNTFTLPMAVSSGGTATMAMWTTMNATSVVIRVKNGPAEFETQVSAMVNAGMTSLRPARTTTYVLEAYNDAGDKDVLEKTVMVTTPVIAGATPNPTAPNALVMLNWDVGGANPADIIGIPAEPPVVTPASTGFFDIETNPKATKLNFSQTNDATASFTPGFGFSFPVVGAPVTTFTASTNGFLALAATSTLTGANVDFKATTGLPTQQVIAPLWDDLDLLNTGSVHWLVEGTSFPRRLIVQWSKVRVAGDPATDLTFQVQLLETGEVRFEYMTLAGGGRSQGDNATVGIFYGTAIFAGQHSYNMATLSDGLELVWFTNGLATGSRNIVVASQSVSLGFFYKTVQGAFVYVPIDVRVFGAGSIVVNEVMPQPAAGVTEGQYIELYNASGRDQDLGGLEVSTTSGATMTFVIPPNTNVAPKNHVVLGQSTSGVANGGATVDVPYGTALPIGASDTAMLRVVGSLLLDGGAASPFVVNAYNWPSSTPGFAVQRDPALGGGIPLCTRTQTYGSAGSVGTPGATNESCFPYVLTSIPAAYDDISATGTSLLAPEPEGIVDEVVGTAGLTMPFTYFGVPYSALTVSSNGWISATTQTSATFTNKAAPGSGTPRGVIAVYWDDLINNVAVGPAVGTAFAKRATDHHVIQWNRMSPFRSLTAPFTENSGDLNFQAKLFDTGVIEFHYAGMVDAPGGCSTCPAANGASATVWLELPDGGAALPVSINTPDGVAPNSAWRFTPKP